MFYNGQGGLERCVLLDFWKSLQLLQNNFFDPNTPMRKVNDGGEKKMGKNNVGNSDP